MEITGQMGIVRREQGNPTQNLSASGGRSLEILQINGEKWIAIWRGKVSGAGEPCKRIPWDCLGNPWQWFMAVLL
jgi:hypothetical protein